MRYILICLFGLYTFSSFGQATKSFFQVIDAKDFKEVQVEVEEGYDLQFEESSSSQRIMIECKVELYNANMRILEDMMNKGDYALEVLEEGDRMVVRTKDKTVKKSNWGAEFKEKVVIKVFVPRKLKIYKKIKAAKLPPPAKTTVIDETEVADGDE